MHYVWPHLANVSIGYTNPVFAFIIIIITLPLPLIFLILYFNYCHHSNISYVIIITELVMRIKSMMLRGRGGGGPTLSIKMTLISSRIVWTCPLTMMSYYGVVNY